MSRWDQTAVREFIQKSSLFSGFDASTIGEVAQCAVRQVAANELLFHEGLTQREEFYLLLEGQLGVLTETGERLNYLKPGDIFGETAIFKSPQRMASIRAEANSFILTIPVSFVQHLAERDYRTGMQFIERIYSVTLSYLKAANQTAVELLKEKKDQGIFIIILITFLSLFSVATPYLNSLIKTIFPTIITAIVVFIGVLFMWARMIITKMPLSTIGVTKKNLGKSLVESFIATSIFLLFVIAVKYLLIHFIPAFHEGKLFWSITASTLQKQGILLSEREVLFYMLVYSVHAFFQELLVRGALQGTFEKFFSFKHRNGVAITLASLIFSCAHVTFGFQAVLAIFIPSLFWGWLYSRQKNIFGVAFSHIMMGLIVTCLIGTW